MLRKKRYGVIGRNGGSIDTIIDDYINIALSTKIVKRRFAEDDGMICSWNGKDRSGGLKEEEGKKFVESAVFVIETSIASSKGAGFNCLLYQRMT